MIISMYAEKTNDKTQYLKKIGIEITFYTTSKAIDQKKKSPILLEAFH